ncbi:MAG: hypothetical protein GX766_09760 [Firmicutes bacterium]|nr:hypothetical protein [Bacillota bacterium]HQD40322.1 hypothetical protein [Bacillota bacterium]
MQQALLESPTLKSAFLGLEMSLLWQNGLVMFLESSKWRQTYIFPFEEDFEGEPKGFFVEDKGGKARDLFADKLMLIFLISSSRR